MTSLKCPDCGQDIAADAFGRPSVSACPKCGRSVLAGKTDTGEGTRLLDSRANSITPGTPITRGEGGRTDTVAPIPTSPAPSKTYAESHPGQFPFLSPPRGQDTLGWLAHYRVEKLLGQGGMGMVFMAEDDKLKRRVALKVMRPEMATDDEFRQRFLREALAMAALKSDHIVTIFEVAQDQVTFLAMEFLQGETLDDWLNTNPKPSIGEVVRIGREVALGLAAAHAQGLIHRDIKPANIWLEGPSRRVKILDFGLARPSTEKSQLTQAGLILGTPEYMAPEQADGDKVDYRCDLFSLGAVLYQMAAGENPFAASSTMAVLKAVALREPKPLRSVNKNVPEALAELIHMLLAKKREDRPESAEVVAEELEVIAQDPDVAATMLRPLSARLGARPPIGRRRRTASWVSVALLVGLLLVAFFLSRPYLFPPPVVAPPPVAAPRPTFRGVGEDSIIVGMSAPFDGPNKELGDELKRGIDAYFSRINDQGGINGRKIDIIALDDKYQPDKALANMKDLFEKKKVFVAIGNVGTPTAKVTVPYAVENKYLFFGGFTGAQLLRKDPPDRYVFNYRASYEQETEKIVHYLVKSRDVDPKAIAVFAQNDSFGDDGFAGVVDALSEYKIKRDSILRVNYDREKQDVRAAADEIIARPDIKAVIMVATYKPAARFIQRVREKRPDMIFTNVSFVGADALAEALRENDPKGGEGVIITQVVPDPRSSAKGVLQYQEDLKKYYSEKQPSFNSLEGYIDAAILAEGIKRAGDNLTTESLIDALESIKNLDLGIGPMISYGPVRHQGTKKVWGTVINKEGKLEVLKLESGTASD